MNDKLVTLIPLEELEQEAQQQIYRELSRPFLKKLAIMPDCHTGYTLPIGGVALLDNVVSPEYVGYDIGCGMCCLITPIDANEIKGDELSIFDDIYKEIPVGFNCGKHEPYLPFVSASGWKNLNDKVNARLHVQLGTLGSGNHFIEIGRNTNGKLAVTIHSGSRNIGHSVAGHYMKSSKTADVDLPAGFLHVNSTMGKAYLADMQFCLDYALANRKIMMSRILDILGLSAKYLDEIINENHNHLLVTSEGILHRKGATPADKGQLGVIPGNMRDGVYITTGLGNETYLSSASHGAGRTMSRKKAKETIRLKDFKESMKGKFAKVDESTLDEASFAYKDVHTVIDRQKGIVVDVIDHITSIINIKG